MALATADEAEILKHNSASVTSISANTMVAITSADGYYNLTITAAQLDTEGRLTVLINDTSLCLPVRADFIVQHANVFDSFHAAATTDYLQVEAINLSLGGSPGFVSPVGFTDESMITRLYSSAGLSNILDDVSGTDEDDVISQVIVDAEQTVISRLSQWFDPDDMVTNNWVNSRTTWIAAHFLSMRRGNEHYFEHLYQEAITELNAMASGELQPPHDIPLRFESTASMANYKIDERFGVAKT
ncbi:unnamed protein product, partial [marine sediment metagenome]